MELNQLRLRELYQLYIENSDDDVLARAIELSLEERSGQASAMFLLSASNMSQQDLDEQLVRLRSVMDASPESEDEAADYAEREMARVQMEVVEYEIRRRNDFYESVQRNEWFAPSRSNLIGRTVVLAQQFSAESSQGPVSTFVQSIVDVIQSCYSECPAGGEMVASVLRKVDRVNPPGRNSDPMTPWVRWAVALSLMSSEHGFGDEIKPRVDPVTEASANEAKRLFFALQRQDPRYDEIGWPLDMTGSQVADVVENAAIARKYWQYQGFSDLDRIEYLTPTRREEQGRPDPHGQIVYERAARDKARHSGGITFPMLYPILPRNRRLASREIWKMGIPPVPEGELGIPLYGAPGDLRIQWGAGPHPDGILCAVSIPRERILSIGRKEDAPQEGVLQEAIASLERQGIGGGNFEPELRKLLIAEGYLAIARYDYLYRDTLVPQELILLDTSEDHVYVIRESVPPFILAERPLQIPRTGHVLQPARK